MRAGNASVIGDITEGKRRYVVRTEGDLDTLDQVRSVVLRWLMLQFERLPSHCR